jgi:uncharacterized protein (TIGR03437 family)
MQRLVVALVLAAPFLQAQFFDFAVTDDGRLFFSTPLTAGSEHPRFKVYRLAGERLELVATGSEDDGLTGLTASAPFVSGDGSVFGWAVTLPCLSGSCGLSGLPRVSYRLRGAGVDRLTVRNLQVSRNGRYLAASTYDGRVQLIELPSQRTTEFGPTAGLPGVQAISDEGGVLMYESGYANSLVLRSPGGELRPVPGSEGVLTAVLSPAGDRIAIERSRDGLRELVLGETVLDSAPVNLAARWPNFSFHFQPRFANDGTLLYIDSSGQPAIVPPGGRSRHLAAVDGGVQRSILSGDGNTAWLATYSGRLLRVQVDSGSIEEVIPVTPYLLGGGLWGFPGSVVRFTGSGITRAIRFEIGDRILPVSALGDDFAYAQIPWEYPIAPGFRALSVRNPASPFHQRLDLATLDRPWISFERDGDALKAAHQDFRGLVSAADAARPGETLHVFARNMGPVDSPVATGEPSPDPPSRVTTPMACYLFEVSPDNAVSRPVGLVVPFAGLSPGLIGVYHIDVTIPADWRSSRARLSCYMDSGGGVLPGDSADLDVNTGPQQRCSARLPAALIWRPRRRHARGRARKSCLR